jgi:NADPH-dependent ferric siderophore reductase
MSQLDRVALPASLLAIPGVQPLDLEVAELADLGPRMRRIRLHGQDLDTFVYQPGQDVMLVLGQVGDRPLSRRYSIRGLDRRRRLLELNVVAHGVDGPGARWAATARPGDRVVGVGPRGKITLDPAADWHLFAGDETAAPASLAMLEALPADVPAVAYLEVTSAEDELPTMATDVPTHQVIWLHRGTSATDSSSRLVEALASATLPAGRGHVYLAGEVHLVSTLKDAVLGLGLAPEQVSAKAYWGRGRPNASRGEPD